MTSKSSFYLRLEDYATIRRPNGIRVPRCQLNPLALIRASVLLAHGNDTSRHGGRCVHSWLHVNATGKNDC